MIVTSDNPVTLIGGAPVDHDLVWQAADIAPVIVAADGGADQALRSGLEPVAVIGDMDSISPATRQTIPLDRLYQIAEQDSTDFDKCLRNIMAPMIIGVGFADGRFDHQLATCNTLCQRPGQRCIILGAQDLIFVAPPQLVLDLPSQTRVSLFPMQPVTGQSTGLQWPIDGLELEPGGQIATSNMATGPITITAHAPGLLVILPQKYLRLVIAALSAAPQWTAQDQS